MHDVMMAMMAQLTLPTGGFVWSCLIYSLTTSIWSDWVSSPMQTWVCNKSMALWCHCASWQLHLQMTNLESIFPYQVQYVWSNMPHWVEQVVNALETT